MKSTHIKGLSHIGLFVDDIEVSKKFYTEIIGADIIWEFEHDEGLKIAFAKIGDCVIEIVEFPQKLYRGDGVIAHLAFDVDDIDQAYAELKAKGVVFDAETITTDPKVFPNGSRYIMFRGPDREHLEIHQKL